MITKRHSSGQRSGETVERKLLAVRALTCLLSGAAIGSAIAGCGAGISTPIPSAPTKATAGVPTGPVLGYIWTAGDGTLRPMLGVVGSGQVGASIIPADTYVSGAASSASEIGLVEDDSGNLFMLDLPTPTVARVATGLALNAQIVFSPSGTRAIAYAPGTSSITVISGLSGQPAVSTYNVPAGARLAVAAVSDTGTVLAALSSSPSKIGTLASSGNFSQVTTLAQVGGMSFLAGADDALVTDTSTSRLLRLNGVSQSPAVQTLASTGLNRPVALANSRDGRWAVVANAGDQSTVRVDLTTGTPNVKLACTCQPNQMNVLAGGQAFRVNDLSNGPVWIADVSQATPQMIFVPAIH